MKQGQNKIFSTLLYMAPECETMTVESHGVLCGSITDPSSTITDVKEEKLDNGFWI